MLLIIQYKDALFTSPKFPIVFILLVPKKNINTIIVGIKYVFILITPFMLFEKVINAIIAIINAPTHFEILSS